MAGGNKPGWSISVTFRAGGLEPRGAEARLACGSTAGLGRLVALTVSFVAFWRLSAEGGGSTAIVPEPACLGAGA